MALSDPRILLDGSTPFDDAKVALLDQVVAAMFGNTDTHSVSFKRLYFLTLHAVSVLIYVTYEAHRFSWLSMYVSVSLLSITVTVVFYGVGAFASSSETPEHGLQYLSYTRQICFLCISCVVSLLRLYPGHS